MDHPAVRTAEIGAILVPINPAYRTSELGYVINQAGIRLLVAAPSFRTSDYAALLTNSQSVSPTVTCAADVSLQPGWNRSPGLTRRWQPPAPGYRVVPERADGGWSAAAGDRAGGPQVPGGSGVWLRPGVRRGLAGFGCFR